MSLMNKVVPIKTVENISPFSAISGPLRALNIMGALPLKFHDDISGKIKVINIHYVKYKNYSLMEIDPLDFLFKAS